MFGLFKWLLRRFRAPWLNPPGEGVGVGSLGMCFGEEGEESLPSLPAPFGGIVAPEICGDQSFSGLYRVLYRI